MLSSVAHDWMPEMMLVHLACNYDWPYFVANITLNLRCSGKRFPSLNHWLMSEKTKPKISI